MGHPVGGDIGAAHNAHLVRSMAQAGDGRVEAHIEEDGVGSGLEQQGVALGAELVALHLPEHGVGLRLDLGGRHAGVEDVHMGPKERAVRSAVGSGCVHRGGGRSIPANHGGAQRQGANEGDVQGHYWTVAWVARDRKEVKDT